VPINTRLLIEADTDLLRPILERWIRDSETGEPFPNEVEDVIREMRASLTGLNDRTYITAETLENGVIGVIGFRHPEERMIPFTTRKEAAELINAYVAEKHRAGKGVGSSLVSALEHEVKKRGFTQVVLNSGPRYKDTAWGFYDRLAGYKRVGIVENMYGVGRHAPVWRKELTNNHD